MKIIILDRDGVINKCMPNNEYVTQESEIKYLDENIDVFKKIRKEIPIFIVTNQQGVGKGLMSAKNLDIINNKIILYLKKCNIKILKIYTCTHLESDNCNCRKPKPGMLQSIVKEFGVDLSESLFIGDSETDVICANSVKSKSVYFGINKIKCTPTFKATNSIELLKILELNGFINDATKTN
jgi:D-glycero-D-manno-heptose 1,7-bisphosphate phosphatase